MTKALAALVLVALVLSARRSESPATTVPDGTVIGAETWELARDLLPAEILDHYRKDEYRNVVLDASRPGLRSILPPPEFQRATESNRGRYDLNAAGSIVEIATGKQPPHVVGFPFPDITPDDPKAGTKIVWNFFYSNWYRGSCHFETELVMLSRTGIERRIVTDVRMLLYDGAPESEATPNPRNLLQQNLAKVVAPEDLRGTVSLTWRYRDTGHDSLWTYVPGLRRARPVNPLNRSDGFLGSDISLDDGPFFDAKPETFTFRLVERRSMLALMDPFSIRGEAEIAPAPGGGWRVLWKDVPRIGADDPAWKGVPWAPVSAVLVERPVYVVEARPTDPNYLYGRLVLRFDTETFRGTWSTKYDRADVPIASYQVSNGAYSRAPDGSWIPAGGTAVQTGENLLYDRATVVLFPPRDADNPADFRVAFEPEEFTPDVLVRMGR